MKKLILFTAFTIFFSASFCQNHRSFLADFGAGITNHAEFNGDLQFGFQKPYADYYLTAVGSVFAARWHNDKSTHALVGP